MSFFYGDFTDSVM